MKIFISKLLLFFPFLVFSYVLLVFVWGYFKPSVFDSNLNYRIGSYGHLHSRISEIKEYRDVDILFLGSSHTYRGFDPRIFSRYGFKSFNLGSSAQTPIQTKVLLKRYLDYLNPKTVIYDVFPSIFKIDGVESSLDIIANDENDIHSLIMAFEINNIKTYNTLIFGFICDFFEINSSFKESIKRNEDTYIKGGFVEREIEYFQPIKSVKKDHKKIKEKRNSINDIFREDQLSSFLEVLEMLRKKNINIILVYTPIISENYKRQSYSTSFDSTMKKFGNYYNFNEIIPLNDTLHFYDPDHLNQIGVELFNENLIEFLDEKNKLKQKQ